MGAHIEDEGGAIEFGTYCIFLRMGTTLIELICPLEDGNHIDRFIKKFGDGKLHHIAIVDKTIEGKKGALPDMYVEFNKPNEECGLLIEKVRFKHD